MDQYPCNENLPSSHTHWACMRCVTFIISWKE